MAARRKKASRRHAPTKRPGALVIKYEGQSFHEAPVVYTNNAQITISTFDVQIRLNRVIEAKEGELKVINQTTVMMSSKYALAFAELLMRNVDAIKASSQSEPEEVRE